MKKRRSNRAKPAGEELDSGLPAASDLTPAREPEGVERLRDTWANIEKELSGVRAERDRLLAAADGHDGQLAEQQRRVAAYRSQVETLQAELAGARRRLEERNALDGVQSGRGSADKRLADYRDALLGMEHTLAERERAILNHATEKAELTARIAELQRQFAEITGRWRESEAANGRLQAMLTDAARAAERLEGELRQAREGAERMAQKAVEQEALVSKLRGAKAGEASAQENGAARLREARRALAEEKQRGAGLLAQLRERDQKLAALDAALERQRAETRAAVEACAAAEARLAGTLGRQPDTGTGEERQAIEALRVELAGAREELARRESRIAEVEARAASLARDVTATENAAGMAVAARDRIAAQLEEKAATVKGLERRIAELVSEMESQRQAAQEAESDRRRQRNNAAVLGRELERAEGVDAGIRKREGLMARHAATADADKRRKARLVVSLEGDHNIKYPLYKPAMIIGRASDADIHVIGRFTSRRHARILILDDDTAVIEDLGSLNGIRVNDQNVTRHALRDGDMLDIGGARLQFIDLAQRESARSNAG
jgi:chromosome segregation ATPase